MGEATRTATTHALSERAQHLLRDNRPAESVPILKELIERLDTEELGDLQARAEARRLLGTALRESGELAGSTAALEDSIRILRPAAESSGQKLVLAIALRSVAMNYTAAGQVDQADAARRDSLDLAKTLLEFDPEQTSRIFFAITEDLQRARHTDWEAPLTVLMQKTASLEAEPALRVLLALNTYWRERGNVDRARLVASEAQKRISRLDATSLSSNFAIVHNLAFAALYCDAVDAAREMADRLSGVVETAKTDRVYDIRHLKALVALRSDPGQHAVDLARDVYTFARESFGDDHHRTRLSQRELADALDAAHQSDEAIGVYRAVLDREERVGKDHLTTAEIAFTLGKLLDAKSHFEEAIGAHWTSFVLREKALGAGHSTTNQSRHEVAELSRVLGRVEEAEYLFREALEVEQQVHGPETEFGALICNNLGDVYSSVGRYALARTCINQALAIRTKLFGDDSEGVWRSRESLAILVNRTGDVGQAVMLARAAVARKETARNALWHLVLATGLLRQGQHVEAEDIFRRLHKLVPRDLIGSGVAYDVYFEIVEGLTACRSAREDWPGAVEAVASVAAIVRDDLTSVIQDSSEMQLTQFARRVLDLQSLWLWSLSRIPTPTAEQLAAAFELVQLTKSLRTRYLRWRQPGAGNIDEIRVPEADESLKELLAEMRQRQGELTHALLSKDEDDGHPEPMPLLFTRLRLRQIERQLAGRIGDSEVSAEEALSSGQLLPDGAVAIELLVVRDVIAERRNDWATAHHYMAFVVGPGATQPALRLVDLGLCDELDNAVTAMRDSLLAEPWTDNARPPAWRRLSNFLGAKILTPMWTEIAAGKHLLIAPDGLLGALPFEILSTPEGEYLLDKINVSYLMRVGELGRDRQPYRKGSPPLVMAGPDFDLPNAFVGRRMSAYGPERLLARALGGAARFQQLPEARVEGTDVAMLLEVEALIGVWALAPELGRSQSPEIIHLSTHGFSLPYKDAELSASLAAPLGNALDRRVVLEDPMQRSGLAMSGANALLDGRAIPPEAGTGTLFAADIQQFDLQRTDMVVLSACRSGLGDVAVGDGAHGLRRAFFAAGARTVVSALWDVPDASSRTLVTHFYKRLLAKATRFEALADARAAVRANHPRDPVHWAGFVLDGSFGPLGRFSALSDLWIAQVSFKDWVTSANDEAGMDRLAKRMASGPTLDPSFLTSVVTLRQVVGRPELEEDTRIFVLKLLGDLSNRLGDNDSAFRWYRKVLESKNASAEDRVTVTYSIAKILHTSGKVREGVDAYTALLAQGTGVDIRSRVLVNRGTAYAQLELMDDAIADYTAVIEDKSAPADQKFIAHMSRSGALSDVEDAKGALDDIDAAMASGYADDGEMLKLRMLRAKLWIATGNRTQALDEIAELERSPNLTVETRTNLERLRGRAS